MKYVAYLLTDFVYNEYQGIYHTDPIKIVKTKNDAFDFIMAHEGGVAVWGIGLDGDTYPIMTDTDYCLSFGADSKRPEEDFWDYYERRVGYVNRIKKLLKIK